jgi:hypothetical protein
MAGSRAQAAEAPPGIVIEIVIAMEGTGNEAAAMTIAIGTVIEGATEIAAMIGTRGEIIGGRAGQGGAGEDMIAGPPRRPLQTP